MDYKSTATYYWSLLAENGFVSDSVTGFHNGLPGESANGNDVEAVAGPFGFDEAIKLGEKQVIIVLSLKFSRFKQIKSRETLTTKDFHVTVRDKI